MINSFYMGMSIIHTFSPARKHKHCIVREPLGFVFVTNQMKFYVLFSVSDHYNKIFFQKIYFITFIYIQSMRKMIRKKRKNKNNRVRHLKNIQV